MKSQKHSNKGFAPVLILVFVFVAIGVVYYFLSRNYGIRDFGLGKVFMSSPSNSPYFSPTPLDETAKYINKKYGFEFSYPESLKDKFSSILGSEFGFGFVRGNDTIFGLNINKGNSCDVDQYGAKPAHTWAFLDMNTTQANVGGIITNVYEGHFSDKVGPGSAYAAEACVLKDGYTYHFYSLADSVNKVSAKSLIWQILSTFKFVD